MCGHKLQRFTAVPTATLSTWNEMKQQANVLWFTSLFILKPIVVEPMTNYSLTVINGFRFGICSLNFRRILKSALHSMQVYSMVMVNQPIGPNQLYDPLDDDGDVLMVSLQIKETQ